MLRTGLIIIMLTAFMMAVGLGVNTSIQQFNQIVLPEQPLKLYDVIEKRPGVMQFELVGETFSLNIAGMKQQAKTVKELALSLQQQQLESVATLVKGKWQALVQTEEIRAVNQWVKERI